MAFAALYLTAFTVLSARGYGGDALRTLEYSLMFVALAFVAKTRTEPEREAIRRGRNLVAQIATCAAAIAITGYFGALLGSEDDTAGIVFGLAYRSGAWQFAIEVCFVFLVFRFFGVGRDDLGIRRWARGANLTAFVWIATAIGFLAYDVVSGALSSAEALRDVVHNVFRNGFSEEFLFRGALLSRLRLVVSNQWAILCQALLFAAWHYGTDIRAANGDPLVAACFMVTVQGVFGYALGYLAVRTRSIAIGSAFHAIADATSII